MTAPAALEYKTAGTTAAPEIPPALAGPNAEGIVTAIVAVTGVKDDVDDVIIPGAFKRTLAERRPKVCLGHDWNRPIGKTLDIKELMPGDPGLPKLTAEGAPWPEEAGAVIAQSQYNLATEDGRKAFQDATFFGQQECYQSIGYRVPPEGKTFKGGVRYISELELFEYGPVLHPANRLATIQATKGSGASREDNALRPGEVKAKRYVQDADFWGMPVGTLITDRMKPRGKLALEQRQEGHEPDRNAGVTTEAPKDDLREPTKKTRGPAAAPDEREVRVKPADPQGHDEVHVQNLVENEVGAKNEVARDRAFLGLLDEGITPPELEDDLKRSEGWPEEMAPEDRAATIADVLADYKRTYRREAQRQANVAAKTQPAGGEPGAAPAAPPRREKADISALSTEELDGYVKAATAGVKASKGDRQKRFQAVLDAATAEKQRRTGQENGGEGGGAQPGKPAPAAGGAGPGADRAVQLVDEPWRMASTSITADDQDPTSVATREAATQAFGEVAARYAPVLGEATAEEFAAAEAKLAARRKANPDVPENEAMTIAYLLPPGEARETFIADVRTAMKAYQDSLAALQNSAA
jgi:hypothetical protein